METLELCMAERGQIVIPKKARDALGLRPRVKLELRVLWQTLLIQKSVKLDLSRWRVVQCACVWRCWQSWGARVGAGRCALDF